MAHQRLGWVVNVQWTAGVDRMMRQWVLTATSKHSNLPFTIENIIKNTT